MIFGIGTDLVNSERIAKILGQFPDKFLKKYFSDSEIEHALNQKTKQAKILYISKRFAAKEACAKAIGTGIRGNIQMKNIEITNNDLGKPHIHLMGITKDTFESMIPTKKEYSIHLSLSDDIPFAMAYVMIEVLD